MPTEIREWITQGRGQTSQPAVLGIDVFDITTLLPLAFFSKFLGIVI